MSPVSCKGKQQQQQEIEKKRAKKRKDKDHFMFLDGLIYPEREREGGGIF